MRYSDSNVCLNAAGPENAKIIVSTLTPGQAYDQGPVCANEKSGYIYIESNCSDPAQVLLTFLQTTYRGPVCLDLNGHHLSGQFRLPSASLLLLICIFTVHYLASYLAAIQCAGSPFFMRKLYSQKES